MGKGSEISTINGTKDAADAIPAIGDNVFREADSTEVNGLVNDKNYWQSIEQSLIKAGFIAPFTQLGDGSLNFPHWRDCGSLTGNRDLIAQNYDGRPATLIPDFLAPVAERFAENAINPLRGIENQIMSNITTGDSNAWEQAVSAFPQISKHPELAAFPKAYVKNEVHHYDTVDWAEDTAANQDIVMDDKTIGLTQISPRGLRELETGIINGHQVREPYTQLTSFLESKGYSRAGHEVKALLDLECAPMIAAAKTAALIEDLEKHNVPVNMQTVAYASNPDVYSHSNGKDGRKYESLYGHDVHVSKLLHWDQAKELYGNNPKILNASRHVKNIMTQLNEL